MRRGLLGRVLVHDPQRVGALDWEAQRPLRERGGHIGKGDRVAMVVAAALAQQALMRGEAAPLTHRAVRLLLVRPHPMHEPAEAAQVEGAVAADHPHEQPAGAAAAERGHPPGAAVVALELGGGERDLARELARVRHRGTGEPKRVERLGEPIEVELGALGEGVLLSRRGQAALVLVKRVRDRDGARALVAAEGAQLAHELAEVAVLEAAARAAAQPAHRAPAAAAEDAREGSAQ